MPWTWLRLLAIPVAQIIQLGPFIQKNVLSRSVNECLMLISLTEIETLEREHLWFGIEKRVKISLWELKELKLVQEVKEIG